MFVKNFRLKYWHRYLVWYVILALIILGIVLKPQDAVEDAKNALILCGQVIIPSLLPFFVASSLLVSLGFASVVGNLINPIMRPVFGVSGKCGIAFVLGVISGYPVGAMVTADLYKNGDCDRAEAQKLLAFCNNSGPLFVIGAVGVGMFHSTYIGYVLYISHIISAILVGIIFGLYRRSKKEIRDERYSPIEYIKNDIRRINIDNPKSVGELIADSVKHAAIQMVNICAFVVFFTVVGNLLYDYGILDLIAGVFFKDEIYRDLCVDFLRNLVEMTAALKHLVSVENIELGLKIALVSFSIGFAGISVHLQTMGVLSKTGIKMKSFILGKLMQGGLSAILSALLIWIIPKTRPAFMQLDDRIFNLTINNFWNNLSNSLFLLSVSVIILLIISVITYIVFSIINNLKNDNI